MKKIVLIIDADPQGNASTGLGITEENRDPSLYTLLAKESFLKESIKKTKPDLILLDWMLPDISGVEVCKNLKRSNLHKNIPIIMLTAKGEEEDKLKGFETGADDYVTKPFSQKELIARVNALLKRSKPSVAADVVVFEDLKVDRVQRRVYRADKQVIVGPTEFKLIDFLISLFLMNGTVQSRNTITSKL